MQTDRPHKIKWKVSLSNGETLYEGKGDYTEVAGDISPWQKLNKYVDDNQLEITSLSLYTDDNRTFNFPSRGKRPKFARFDKIEKPLDYNIKRAIAREMDALRSDSDLSISNINIKGWFTVMEAIYSDYTIELWVDELSGSDCWVLIDYKGKSGH